MNMKRDGMIPFNPSQKFSKKSLINENPVAKLDSEEGVNQLL
jgi:hypothetical protein